MASTTDVAASSDVAASCRTWYCHIPPAAQAPHVDDRGAGQRQKRGITAARRFRVRPSAQLVQPLRWPTSSVSRAFTVWWRQFSTELLPPLRVRDFRLLFAGQFISSVGDQCYLVALPWLILDGGGTPQDLGLVLSAYGVLRIGALLAGGKLSDLLRPRRVMLLADVVRALVLLTLTMLTVLGHPPLWLLGIIVAPLGLFTGLFLPASYAIAPDLVPTEQLQAANAITGSSLQLARLVGPGLGGIVVGQLRASAALAVDALSFIASVGTLAAIHHDRNDALHYSASTARSAPMLSSPAPPDASDDTVRPQSAADAAGKASGANLWQLIRQSPLLRAILIFIGLANVTSGGVIEVALPGYTYGPLAAGATGYGLVLGAWGAGALVGGAAAGGLGHVGHRGRLMLLVTLGESAGIALTPLAGHLFGIIGVVGDLAVFGLANGLSNVLLISLVQQSFPRHLLGRVTGAFLLAAYGVYPLSVVLSGLITQRYGPMAMFPIAALVLLAAVTYAWVQGTLHVAHEEKQQICV